MGGRLQEARAQLLVCVRDGCPRFIHDDCAQWLSEVEATQPTLVFAALDDAGRDLTGATVSLDGAAVANATDGREHTVDPGQHVVRLQALGRSVEASIVVRSGEKARRVELRLPPAERPTLAAPTASPGGERPVPASVWVTGGTSVALLATGFVLWGVGRAAASRYDAQCQSSGCTAGDHDAVERQLVAGDVAVGVGVVVAAVAAYLFLSRPARAAVAF
jgi:hypothetical protein